MDIGTLGTNYLNSVKDTAVSNSSNIEGKLKSDMSQATDEELMDACKKFEAYFLEQIFKNMKQAMVPKSEESDGATATLKNYYEDELTKQYASSAADQSENGLAQMLYEQMKRNYSTVDPGDI